MPQSNRYSHFQMESNRYSGQTSQKVLQKTLIFLEEAIKFTASFIGQMVRMFLGK